MPRGCCVASKADVVWAVGFEVGTTATGVTGKDSGMGTTTGGASNWGRDWGRGGGVSLDGRSTLHKGSRDPGSKSRKAAEGGVSDVKGRNAGVVICWCRRSIAIGRVRSQAISSWRCSGNVMGVAAIKVDSKVRSREGA